MLKIIRYNISFKKDWDELVVRSRNGTFLICRDYMDYHSDRFDDCSFIIFKKEKIEAVIPGNIKDGVFHSHQGLTYGGLISSEKIGTKDVLEIFELLNSEFKKLDIKEVIYKPIPLFYHRIPAQEDLYALFRLGAIRIGCNISTAIFQNNKIKFSELRRRGSKRCINSGVEIIETNDFKPFWIVLNNNLWSQYKTLAVHSHDEIQHLYNRFPNNIKLFTANLNGEILGGVLLFLMDNIAHVQYISATPEGKDLGALDRIFDELINYRLINTPIFEFGSSTEKQGNYLNENLISQKEGFGGRGAVYDIFKYIL